MKYIIIFFVNIFILLFKYTDSWKKCFIIDAVALGILGLITLFLIYESPLYELQNSVDDFLKNCKKMAGFNGRKEKFEEEIENEEYKDIIKVLKENFDDKKEDDDNDNNKDNNENNNNDNDNNKNDKNLKTDTELIVSTNESNENNNNNNNSNNNNNNQKKNNVNSLILKDNDIGNNNKVKLKQKEKEKLIDSSSQQNMENSNSNSIYRLNTNTNRNLTDSENNNNSNNNNSNNNNTNNNNNNNNSNNNNNNNNNQKKSKKSEIKVSPLALLIYPSLRYKFLLCCLLWFLTSGIYNGIALGIKNLPGDVFLNGIILYIIETLCYFTCGIYIDIKILGRKKTSIITYFLSAIFAFLLIIFINYDTLSIIFYMIMKYFITIPFCVFYTYCLEIYPTCIRSIGFGINAVFNQLGGMVIPLIMELFSSRVIYIVFCILSLLCGILFFLLEETYGTTLPETIKEIEEQKKKEFENGNNDNDNNNNDNGINDNDKDNKENNERIVDIVENENN